MQLETIVLSTRRVAFSLGNCIATNFLVLVVINPLAYLRQVFTLEQRASGDLADKR